MKNKNIISFITTVLLLQIYGMAYCGSDLSYDDTVKYINETMLNSTSDIRKESYGYIRFNKCSLNYKVSGTYPAGELYDIKYSNIDMSSLNYQGSKVGHDYTAYIILYFNKYFQSKDDFKDITIRTIVVNVSTDEKAKILFKAFLHLGELCGASK